MKRTTKKRIILPLIAVFVLYSNSFPYANPNNIVYADDTMMNFDMDSIMQQSLNTIEHTHTIVDDANFTNDLNEDMMGQIDFFFNEVDNIQDLNSMDTVNAMDAVNAIDDGAWAQDFNDYFSSPIDELDPSVEDTIPTGSPDLTDGSNNANESMNNSSGGGGLLGAVVGAVAGIIGVAAATDALDSSKPQETPPSSVSSSNVINYAKSFLGTPYVWGGTTPRGFDCSGFMQYTYKKFGVKLPRTAREQQNVGRPVANNALQPGDLIFWGRPAHHVGMYIGNGQYIHAPKPGDKVKITPIRATPITNARRVG